MAGCDQNIKYRKRNFGYTPMSHLNVPLSLSVDKFLTELEKMAEDAELQQLAQQDLEKLVISLDDLLADASRLLLPGRNFDSNNSLLEVHAGKKFST